MKRSMSQRSYLGWQKYWELEPWGSFRDNLHAAIIAREVRKAFASPKAVVTLDDFMVENPAVRQEQIEKKRAQAASQFIGMLKVVATKRPRPT